MRKLRAVLIEDETMFRQLILLTLGKVKDLEVIGEHSAPFDGNPEGSMNWAVQVRRFP